MEKWMDGMYIRSRIGVWSIPPLLPVNTTRWKEVQSQLKCGLAAGFFTSTLPTLLVNYLIVRFIKFCEELGRCEIK